MSRTAIGDRGRFMQQDVSQLKIIRSKILENSKVIQSCFESTNQGLPSSIIRDQIKLLDLLPTKTNQLLKVNELVVLGRCFFHFGKTKLALKSLYHADKLATTGNYKNEASGLYSTLGTVYKAIGDNEQAINSFLTALNSNERLTIASALNNLGNIHKSSRKFNKALDYYNKALRIYSEANDLESKCGVLVNIANVALEKNEITKCLKIFNRILKIAQAFNFLSIQGMVLTNKAQLLLLQKKGGQALQTIEKSITILAKIQNNNNLSHAFFTKGKILSAIGDNKNAEHNLKKAYSLCKNSNLKMHITITNALAEFYLNQKQYRLSTLHYKRLNNIVNKYSRFESKRLEYRTKLDRDRQDYLSKIALLKSENIHKQELLKKNKELYKQIEKTTEYKFRAKSLEIELKLKRAQMNPHFIFNSLNSIANFILTRDKETAYAYLILFGKLMRNILDNSTKQEVLLSTEIQFIKDYVKLEQLRFPEKFQFQVNLQSDIDADTCLIPCMLIQPFVENSIVHAFKDVTKRGIIELSISKKDNCLLCEVVDNGIGILIPKKTNDKIVNSYAICSERLDLISKLNPTCKAYVSISNRKPQTGTIVNLVFPFTSIDQ